MYEGSGLYEGEGESESEGDAEGSRGTAAASASASAQRTMGTRASMPSASGVVWCGEVNASRASGGCN